MTLERQAATSLRNIWQAHDERDEVNGWLAATNLYKILGTKPGQASFAGFLTIQAFFLADEAERYQGKNEETEDFFYNRAKSLLTKAREVCGLETESPYHTVKWWKAYRHKNKEGIVRELVEEHRTQFLHLIPDERERYAKLCTEKIIDAATAHSTKNWRVVDRKLEEYFRVYLDAVKRF